VWVRLVALYVWEKPPKKITSPIFFFFLSIKHFSHKGRGFFYIKKILKP